jgi:hypothetical protein
MPGSVRGAAGNSRPYRDPCAHMPRSYLRRARRSFCRHFPNGALPLLRSDSACRRYSTVHSSTMKHALSSPPGRDMGRAAMRCLRNEFRRITEKRGGEGLLATPLDRLQSGGEDDSVTAGIAPLLVRRCRAEARRSACPRSTSPETTACACPPCAPPRSACGRLRGLRPICR